MSIWLTILSLTNMTIQAMIFRKGTHVICDDSQEQFLFKTCTLQSLFMMSSNFTSMQFAATVRAVFIKSVK